MPEATLEQRIEALENELQRARDVQAIHNLMGRYTVNWVPKNLNLQADFYALDEPDVSVEVGDRGVYVGPEAVKTLFGRTFSNPVLEGVLLVHYLASPMVEVAEDGKTAKGVWRSPGIEAVLPPGGGKPIPMWSFGAYAVDFIRKADGWKIWHLHWYRQIKCTYKDAWVDDLSMTNAPTPPGPELGATTYHNPYTPASVQTSIPSCPEPYQTWNDLMWSTVEHLPKDRLATE
jgi:hypothetical protein